MSATAMMALRSQTAGAQTDSTGPSRAVPHLDIQDYGAVGDGQTDATQPLLAAIVAAAQAGGGNIFVPPGDYLISEEINLGHPGIDLLGAGKDKTRFVCTDPVAGLRFGNLHASLAEEGTRTGGFWVDGNDVAWVPMNVERSNKRMFFDIRISRGRVGLAVEGTQNALFEQIHITQCSDVGLILDHGAGGNMFTNIQLWGSPTNLLLRNSGPGNFPYRGRPTDNVFVGGIMEGPNTSINCDHAAGLVNHFIGTMFAGSNTKIRFRHQASSADEERSNHLYLIGCGFVGTGSTGIEHTASWATVYVTACRFRAIDTAFVVADDCWVEMDAYSAGNTSARFANAPGGTQAEEELIRRDAYHPYNFTTPGGDNLALRTWVGTGLGGDRNPHPSYQLQTSGRMAWGPGNSAPDVALSRPASGRLRLDGTFVAQEGLGAGNSEPATTPGTVVRRMQVFDEDGNPLGYVPIYDSIS